MKCTVCVLMVTRVSSDISFDPEQYQYFPIWYLSASIVGVDKFHIKYLQTFRFFTHVSYMS
jgi:hypothetical protein